MRRVVLTVLSLTAAGPLLAQSIAKPVSIPFTSNADGMVVIPATVGDSVSVHVILDTGAGLDILAPSLIRRVGGTSAGRFTGFRMWGERVDIPLFQIPALVVGPMTRRDVVVGTWDVLDSLRLDGIVSLNGFRRQPVTIDFPGKAVTFETAQSLQHRRAGGHTVPFRVDDLRGTALDLMVQFRMDTEVGECEIDTGSQSATVSTRYIPLLRIDTASANVVRHERRTIAGAKTVVYGATLTELSLATVPEVVQPKPRVAFSDIIYDCVVGTDFLAAKVVTLDIANRKLTFASSRPPS